MVPSIESPFTLLKKPVEVIRFDPVILSHVSLCLIPEIFNSIDVILFVCKKF